MKIVPTYNQLSPTIDLIIIPININSKATKMVLSKPKAFPILDAKKETMPNAMRNNSHKAKCAICCM